MRSKSKYVAEPLDNYDVVYKVGFYRPSGEWVDAPHVEGWADFGGFFRGPQWGYLKEVALEYLHWLNGGNKARNFSFD